jgi:hypothetical protein
MLSGKPPIHSGLSGSSRKASRADNAQIAETKQTGDIGGAIVHPL